VSEIYTNDHYDYLFNNGKMPDGDESENSHDETKGNTKK